MPESVCPCALGAENSNVGKPLKQEAIVTPAGISLSPMRRRPDYVRRRKIHGRVQELGGNKIEGSAGKREPQIVLRRSSTYRKIAQAMRRTIARGKFDTIKRLKFRVAKLPSKCDAPC